MAGNIFKNSGNVGPPGFKTDKEYQLYKTRQNAWVTVSGGGKTLPLGEKTFDNSYVVFPWDKLEFKNSSK